MSTPGVVDLNVLGFSCFKHGGEGRYQILGNKFANILYSVKSQIQRVNQINQRFAQNRTSSRRRWDMTYIFGNFVEKLRKIRLHFFE